MLIYLLIFQIIIYEKNEIKAQYNVLEEVKDLCFSPPFLFTVRDLYVTATEIKPGKYLSIYIIYRSITC